MKSAEFKNPVLRSISGQSESLDGQSNKFYEIEFLFSCDPELFINVVVSGDGVNYTAFDSYFADTSCNLATEFFDSDLILNEIIDSGYFNFLPPGETILSFEIRLSGYPPFFQPSNSEKNQPVYQIVAKTGIPESDPKGEIKLLFNPESGSLISSEKTDYSFFTLKSRLMEVFEYANSYYPECKLLSISSIDFNNSASDTLTLGRFVEGYFTFLSKEESPFTIYLFQNKKPIFCGNEFSAGSVVSEQFFLDSDKLVEITNKFGGLAFLKENVGSSIRYLFGNVKIPGQATEISGWIITYQSSENRNNLSFWIDGETGEIIYKGHNVAVEKLQIKPIGFHLGNNFPNPFNGETNFQVTSSTNDNFELSVFDISGREVSSPKIIFIQKGQNQVTVDLSSLSSGIYFCRFAGAEKNTSDRVIQVQKIVLQK